MNDLAQFAGAALGASLFGYLISMALDVLILRRMMDDRIAAIALSCALSFILIMGLGTLFLTKTTQAIGNPIVLPSLGYALSFLAGLAIAGALRMKAYGDDYATNDDQAVFEADHHHSLYDEEVVSWDDRHAHRSFLYRHWVGNLSLPISYWVNSAFLSILMLVAAELALGQIEVRGGSLRAIAIGALAFLFLWILFWIWSSVGIWRSAYWHRRRGGVAFWGHAARLLVLLGAVGTLSRAGGTALGATEFWLLAMGRDPIGNVAEMTVTDGGRLLQVRGNLSQGAADRFASLLETAPGAENVVLTSKGGRMLEANRMASMIRERGLNTRVDEFCMSACVSVLLAGRERSAPHRARIGFHQPAFPGLTSNEMRTAIEQTRSDYLSAGIDSAFVSRALATMPEDMWFPATDELTAAGVLTSPDMVVTAWRSGKGGPARRAAAQANLGDQQLRRDLQLTAAQINASAPTTIDEITRLERAAASGLTLTQFYTIQMADMDIAQTRRNMAPYLRKDTCSNPAMAAAVRDGARFIYSYDSAAGKHLFEVAVETCAA